LGKSGIQQLFKSQAILRQSQENKRHEWQNYQLVRFSMQPLLILRRVSLQAGIAVEPRASDRPEHFIPGEICYMGPKSSAIRHRRAVSNLDVPAAKFSRQARHSM
jgi:hypothetical protein